MQTLKEVNESLAHIKELYEQEKRKREELELKLATTIEEFTSHIALIKSIVQSKIHDLESKLEREKEQRLQLVAWIKANLGPNLEHVKELVGSEVRARLETRSRAKSNSQSTNNAGSPASATTSTESRQQQQQPTQPAITRTPQVRPRKVTRNRKLKQLEEQVFGEDDVTTFTLPENDGSLKTKPTRAQHFLVNQKQALTQYRCPTMWEKVQHFVTRGGRIVFVPLYEADLKKDSFVFGIKTFDLLFPICPDGFNRSQVLYLVFKGIKRLLGNPEGVQLPHGARSGYDPFVLKDDPRDPGNSYHMMPKLIDEDNRMQKAFFEAFGQDRVPRFGEEEAKRYNTDLSIMPNKQYTEAQLQEIKKHKERMRDYFDLYFYNLKSVQKREQGRVIYFVFGSALPIVVERLMEVNYRQDISNALVVALPFGIEPFNSAKAEDLLNVYRFYASLFKPVSE